MAIVSKCRSTLQPGSATRRGWGWGVLRIKTAQRSPRSSIDHSSPFTTAKSQNQPGSPVTEGQQRELCFPHTMGVLQPKKQNKVVFLPRKTDITGNDHVRPKKPVSERQRIVFVESMLPGGLDICEIVIQLGAQRCGCLCRAKGLSRGQ